MSRTVSAKLSADEYKKFMAVKGTRTTSDYLRECILSNVSKERQEHGELVTTLNNVAETLNRLEVRSRNLPDIRLALVALLKTNKSAAEKYSEMKKEA